MGIEESGCIEKDVFSVLSKTMKESMSFMTKEERVKVLKRLSDAPKGIVSRFTYEVPFNKISTGENIWIEVHLKPVTYKGKAGEMILIRDITEHKEAEYGIKVQHEKYQSLVENIEEGLFTLDKRGKILYVNPEVSEKITGYTSDELLGLHFSKLFSAEALSTAMSKFREILKGEKIRELELDLTKKDGTVITVSSIVTPIFEDGKLTKVYGVFSDISKEDIARHPVTGVELLGFQVPLWQEIISTVKEAALVAKNNRSIGWDVAVTSKGPLLIEGNHNWCKLLWQLPVKKGLKSELLNYL